MIILPLGYLQYNKSTSNDFIEWAFYDQEIKRKKPVNYLNLQALILKVCLNVGKTGFEPATPWSQTRCATGLRYFPSSGFLPLSSPHLRKQSAVRAGFEPAVQFNPYGSLANY